MENKNSLKLLSVFWGGALLVSPFVIHAYGTGTHAALTQETIKLFNKEFRDLNISNQDAEHVIQGSIDEDDGIRYMRHFYDPVYNRGLVFGQKWLSSKDWSQDTLAQAGVLDRAFAGTLKSYFSGDSDYSWERAIYEYTWGNKKRGLEALGHVLHLVQDASVPDHTRNDPHPPILDLGSPYEAWTGKFNKNSINTPISGAVSFQKYLLGHFDTLANYSNNNFLSEDTIYSSEYSGPQETYTKVEEISSGLFSKYGYTVLNGKPVRLVKYNRVFSWQKLNPDQKELTLDDDLVLADYWSLLSEQAVLHGAGVIKLFFDEVGKERESKILYEKNRSWVGKQIDKFKAAVFSVASVLYGSSVTLEDLGGGEFSTGSNDNITSETGATAKVGTPEEGPTSTETAEVGLPAGSPTSEIIPTEIVSLELTSTEPVTPPQPAFLASTVGFAPFAPGAGAMGPKPQSETPPEEPEDTTPPDIEFSITECGETLATDGCLVASSTLTLVWNSTAEDLSHFEISCEVGGAPCAGFTNGTTTATTTVYNSENNPSTGSGIILTFAVKAADINENESAPESESVEISTRPVVINEIAWMGTGGGSKLPHDEWVELYNPTSKTVSLAGWTLYSETNDTPYIAFPETKSIPPKSYFLLERTDDDTVSDIAADLTYTGALNDKGEKLLLLNGSTTVDATPDVGVCPDDWCGGEKNARKTMERFDPLASGEDQDNWRSWQESLGISNGLNADNESIKGTPGKRNSVNYLISPYVTFFPETSKTLTKAGSPYVITSQFSVGAGKTLTLEPGTVVKFTGSASLKVDGALKAQGTGADKAVFTSLKDDDCGLTPACGDTNQDATSTEPAAGDWGFIELKNSGSVFENAVIRFGGETGPGGLNASIYAEEVSLTVKNSVIEKSGGYGLRLENASGEISGNQIRENGLPSSAEGIWATDGSLEISENTLSGNYIGLLVSTAGSPQAINVEDNAFENNSSFAVRTLASYPTFSGNTASGNGIDGINIQGTLSQNYTLAKDLTYVIQDTTYQVGAGKTLTFSPGVVIKLDGSGKISVSGKIAAEGTESEKIVFTSLKDDDCGTTPACGDTNRDATSTAPAAGDWLDLTLEAESATSTFSHVIIGYAQRGLNLASSTPSVANALFKTNGVGIFADSNSSVTNGGGIIFEDNGIDTDPGDLLE